jgi:FkbM family methyltransferase
MDPKKLEDWAVIVGDKCLIRAVRQQNKRSRRSDLTIVDYQNDQLLEALTFVKKFDLAIDAGANYGIMTFHLNSKFSSVQSFEIEPRVRDCLKQNVLSFGLKNVTVHECGLGDKEDSVSLKYLKDAFGTRVDPNNIVGDIPIKTIDSFNLPACDFIKIDCEGYEPHIINGAQETINKFRPVILMEDKSLSADYGIDGNAAVELLKKWGYQILKQYNKDCIMAYGTK